MAHKLPPDHLDARWIAIVWDVVDERLRDATGGARC